jgi:hypothetical protein
MKELWPPLSRPTVAASEWPALAENDWPIIARKMTVQTRFVPPGEAKYERFIAYHSEPQPSNVFPGRTTDGVAVARKPFQAWRL